MEKRAQCGNFFNPQMGSYKITYTEKMLASPWLQKSTSSWEMPTMQPEMNEEEQSDITEKDQDLENTRPDR